MHSQKKNSIPETIGKVWHLVSLRMDRELCAAGTDLSADQFRVLTILWADDGQNQQTLADRLGRDRSALTRMIDTLEKKGFVERKACPVDGRVKHVFLAAKGRKIREKASSAAAGAICDALKGFSAEEKEDLEDMLSRMAVNLSTETN